MVDRNWATTLASCNDGCWPATRCRRSSAAQARARRPRQPAEAATPLKFFLCRDPGAGFAPSCLGECAIVARHQPEHRTMWYRKNVGGWERAARLIGGGLMLICGVVALHASPLGLLLSGAGVGTLVTRVVCDFASLALARAQALEGGAPLRADSTGSFLPR